MALTEIQELKQLIERTSLPLTSKDHGELVCRRMAETKAIKAYLNLQNEFFEQRKNKRHRAMNDFLW